MGKTRLAWRQRVLRVKGPEVAEVLQQTQRKVRVVPKKRRGSNQDCSGAAMAPQLEDVS